MKTIILFLVATQALLVATQTPVFSDQYTAKGKIFLPYAEIEEPFTAYFDAKANKSRIDYYGDLMQTLQRADLGEFYKLAYMVDNHGDPVRVCFNMASSPLAEVEVQSVLPDLENFKLKKSDECRRLGLKKVQVEGNCEEWEYRTTFGQKDNKYVFILKRDSNQLTPLYYLMMGYDNLIGSHYDKYEVLYESYNPGPVDPKLFDIYSKYNCRGFPGPGKQAVPLMNPIREYIRGDFDHIENDFDDFTRKHNKSYDQDKEHNYRKSIFRHNYRYIMSENRKNVHFQLAVNHLADRTTKEIGLIRGKQSSKSTFNGGLPFDKTQYDLSKIPEQWDWRLLGAVTPVKDQAICGSCWSFGTTGTIEGVYFAKTGRLLKLSQQQLIDCSWSENNNGCDGGEDFRSYEYIMKTGGLASEEDYGHYLGVDGRCHDKSVKKSVQISGFYNVTKDDPQSLEAALFFNGPVTIAIDASLKSFTFYSNGVFYDPKCSSTNLDHQVLAVGYGELNNQKYWLVKNSWSTYWGNDGYVLINQKNNNCGVMTSPTFPKIK